MSIIFTLLFLINVLTINALDSECPENWLDCGDESHTCVARINQCDDYDDCPNGQDEFGCHDPYIKFKYANCPNVHFYKCELSDRCLPNKWKCDGHKDCPQGDDEHNCRPTDAHCDGFLCADLTCITSKWHCDNVADCPDGSDELNCNGTNKDSYECNKDLGFFKCESTGHCIPQEKVCDNITDCPKSDDEGPQCNKDFCKDAHCESHCMNTPTGAKCYCDDGYHLKADGKTCEDIDECVMNHDNHGAQCSHKCINVVGSYKCDCFFGYSLDKDKHTCKANGEEPLLLISEGTRINGYKLRSREFFSIRNAITQSRGVDIFGKIQRIFWVDFNLTQSVVYSCDRIGENLKPIISSGLKSPEDLAVDWLAGNIYVTDSELNVIIVCDIDGDYCKVLHEVGKVRAITLDPPKGVMFWTEWEKEPGIYTSSMDGSNRRVLINTSIEWPNSLAFDAATGRLYWSDQKLKRIEYYELEHQHRHVLFELENVFQPYSMAVFEDSLFWTDTFSYSLDVCNKFSGRNQSTLLRNKDNFMVDVQVYHPIIQQDSHSIDSPCTFRRCSHLCLLASGHKYTCACPDHLTLGKDMMTCEPKPNETYLLISIDKTVKKVYPETIGRDVVADFKIPSYILVRDFAFDHQTQKIFFVDQQKREISSMNTNDPIRNITSIISASPFSIESLTYDEHSNTLYWLDNVNSQLKVSSIDGRRVATLIEDLDNPVSLALYPEKGRIFIAILGDKPRILVAGMDGKNERVFVSNVGYPVSLFVSRSDERLYWADAKRGTIESIELNKQHLRTNRFTVRHNIQTPMSVAVYNEMLYWTDIDQGYLHHSALGDFTSTSTVIPLPGHHNSSAVKRIQLISAENISNKCLHNSCSHLCVLSELKTTCVCPDGYRLGNDGSTCEKASLCRESEHKCANGTGCFSSIFRCDGYKDCPDGSDERDCQQTCQENESKCKNGVCLHKSFFCDGFADCSDKSDEENCKFKGCGTSSFDCGDGQCVPFGSRCDKIQDCKNNKDESDCRFCDNSDSWKCRNGPCVPMLWICDNTNDCPDGSDEENCKENCYHRCGNGKCVTKQLVCNGIIDCKDKSDEIGCKPEPSTTEKSTTSAPVLTRPKPCPTNEFQCHDGECISQEKVCDGYKDCKHHDDELVCDTLCHNEFFCGRVDGKPQCINNLWICDGSKDCESNLDEEHCEYSKKNATKRRNCRNDTCFNSGVCSNGTFGWKCICTPEFSGKRCENRMKFAAREMTNEKPSHTWIFILVVFIILVSIGIIFAAHKFRNGSMPACLRRDNIKDLNVSFRKTIFRKFKRDNLLDNEVIEQNEMYGDKSCAVVVKDSVINPMFGHMGSRTPTQDIDKLSIKSESSDNSDAASDVYPEDSSLIRKPKKYRIK